MRFAGILKNRREDDVNVMMRPKQAFLLGIRLNETGKILHVPGQAASS